MAMDAAIPEDDSRDKFLCNDHPRPEVLRRAYETLLEDAANPTIQTYSDLAQRLGVDMKALPELAMEALHLADRRSDGRFLTVEPYSAFIQQIDPTIRFQVFLLNRIAKSSWSGTRLTKQAHFLLVYEFLLQANRAFLDYGSIGELNDVNAHLKQRGYEAYSVIRHAKSPIKFNENKLHFWCILADYLGLTHAGPSGARSRHFVVLRQEVLLAFLRMFAEQEVVAAPASGSRPDRAICMLDSFLEWSSRHFLMIPSLTSRQLPAALGLSLLRLEKAGSVELRSVGDAPPFLVPEALGSNGTLRRVSAIVVIR